MTGFLTQSAWAERFGVSIRTFRRWRKAGDIPPPDCSVPGYPRWSLGLVAKTTLIVKVQKRRLFARQPLQSFRHRQQQGSQGAQLGAISRGQHAADSGKATSDAPLNSIAGSR